MLEKTKAFLIPKHLFTQAYKLVKSNAGAAGVDNESLEDFEKNLQNNLYKLWNRMSSGCYFPPAVKAIPIPKKSGGTRILGVPTVGDRIAQMVVRLVFEPEVEKYFLSDSYGYRPNKSALDAVGVTRERCWRHNWVLEFDIKGLFDNLSHELLMKAVRKHCQERWVLLYIERWLKAPVRHSDGKDLARPCGVPQGGVISPVLSNLFLHYVFDKWMQRTHPELEWCRYADDGLVHLDTKDEAEALLIELEERFKRCGLELHPDKTKIVYCKDENRRGKSKHTSFDFLGYTFKARRVQTRKGMMFVSFSPAASQSAIKLMRAKTRKCNWRNRTDLSLQEIAKRFNPVLQGWLNYYGCYHKSALASVWRHFNMTLVAWAMRKYRPIARNKTRAGRFLENIAKEQPWLFAHWRVGIRGSFA
jgi:RNA-directed DNA polymerase